MSPVYYKGKLFVYTTSILHEFFYLGIDCSYDTTYQHFRWKFYVSIYKTLGQILWKACFKLFDIFYSNLQYLIGVRMKELTNNDLKK